ncbi:hypothetical protein ACDA63_15610 [Uliginosibacterium sp. sgz301328]|uniref:hypothetical protein n=1 Tax=Uliginosibacterium sp. sgz301328 TaxID=3243764 RepID=UPI00359F01C7
MIGIFKAVALAAQWWLMTILIPVAIWHWRPESVGESETLRSVFLVVACLIGLCAPFGSMHAVVRWLERH